MNYSAQVIFDPVERLAVSIRLSSKGYYRLAKTKAVQMGLCGLCQHSYHPLEPLAWGILLNFGQFHTPTVWITQYAMSVDAELF
jgi:hypothetical protein